MNQPTDHTAAAYELYHGGDAAQQHLAPFAACKLVPCAHLSREERSAYYDQRRNRQADSVTAAWVAPDGTEHPIGGVAGWHLGADLATAPPAIAAGNWDLSTPAGRADLAKYVDTVRREVVQLAADVAKVKAADPEATAKHQAEHCRTLGDHLDRLKSIERFLARFAPAALATDKALAADTADLHAELHAAIKHVVDSINGNAAKTNRFMIRVGEDMTDLGRRVETIEQRNRVDDMAGIHLGGPGDLPLRFASVNQLGEAVYDRLRTADAWSLEPEEDGDEGAIKWEQAAHHRGVAAVLATMYATARANEQIVEVREAAPFESEADIKGRPATIGAGPVDAVTPSDKRAIKNAAWAHAAHQDQTSFRFPECGLQPCVSWTREARTEVRGGRRALDATIGDAYAEHRQHEGGYRFEDCPTGLCVTFTERTRYKYGEDVESGVVIPPTWPNNAEQADAEPESETR